ncbi:hypothetical protein BC938DRAFT_475003 [Jimgerdemannia flammicorona]|uniref:Uncharacterized protein n=1 Tax=Jimgerdemannia flammicorona TaxID=994334 RepID=A0A433Q1A1_9FUNG|nr:hypothetical protein BC938DRAFT_475003 [Jimgerdemannia flammicorona]
MIPVPQCKTKNDNTIYVYSWAEFDRTAPRVTPKPYAAGARQCSLSCVLAASGSRTQSSPGGSQELQDPYAYKCTNLRRRYFLLQFLHLLPQRVFLILRGRQLVLHDLHRLVESYHLTVRQLELETEIWINTKSKRSQRR